tara:strand:+ start:392 stop:721 length:330 start_codon:yes stop_codon:yes gene_type:complete
MAMPNITLTQAGVGSTTYVIPDFFIPNFNIGLQAVVTGSVSSFSAQFTLDDTTADGYDPTTGNWFAVTGLSAASASAAVAMIIPCRGIRLTITTGTGSVALSIQQAGTR